MVYLAEAFSPYNPSAFVTEGICNDQKVIPIFVCVSNRLADSQEDIVLWRALRV